MPEPTVPSVQKYGAHVFIWRDRYGDADLAGLLDEAVDLGLAFLEVSLGDDVHFDAGELGRRAAARKIELILSPGGQWPMDCDISLEDGDLRRRGLAWHKRALDACVACGAVAYAGAIYGHPGRVEYRAPCRAELGRVAEGLHELAAFAAAGGVRLVVEPMSHFRTHVANTPRQINELIRLADHPNVFSCLDTYHLATEVPDLAEAVHEMMPHLWYFHACENNRGAPGTGMLDWDRIVQALVREAWNGRIGFESYNSSWRDGQFARSRGMFHNVCPDGGRFVRQAKAFIQGRFEAIRRARG